MTVRATSTNAAFDAYAAYKNQCRETKVYLATQIARLQQDGVSGYVLRQVIWHFVSVLSLMDGWAATAGILSAARTYENDSTYNVGTEYQALKSAMVTARNSAAAVIPRDAQGRPVYETLDANGVMVDITYLAVDVAGVVTQCNNVVATIS